MIARFRAFVYSEKTHKYLAIVAAGLYPFLHYFNSNLNISNSWEQLLFMLLLCFAFPLVLLKISKLVFNLKPFRRFESQRLTILNLTIFLVLIGFLVFDFRKKVTVMIIIIAFVVGLLLYKHLKKIVILQLLMSIISGFTLIPVLLFAFHQNNSGWTTLDDDILKIKLKTTPNIFVIQPDGYVNRSIISEQPYDIDNSDFYNFIEKKKFENILNFRSNYYSTMTSNASMFAMKHHYYSNTYKENGKTFNANGAIVGKYNNVLSILNNNNYTSHLMTDNSYFLIDRKPSSFDFSNVQPLQLSFVHTGKVKRNIVEDLTKVLDTISSKRNFFFIEKTIPSHINYTQSNSLGKVGERDRYFNRLQEANLWLTNLINTIENYDNDALVVIVADHGGFVGLNYSLESIESQMDAIETSSAFSSMLSIKWPQYLEDNDIEFHSSVNLFRNIFYSLSQDNSLLKYREKDESYIPLKENGTLNYYKCIDDNGIMVFEKISN